ncbi:MAG: hypothetical protein O7G85_13365 [Planctomycetota bacterium]|nr:hypothetical protein [Planctomycetota bacterium]
MFRWLRHDPEDPSLWADLQIGQAGWVPRVGLSLAAAGGLFSIMFIMLGLIDLSLRLDDHHIAIGIGLAGVTWCVALVFIWASFRKWRKPLKTFFCILGVWMIAIPMAFFVEETVQSEEFFIASILALGLGLTLFLLMTLGYRRGGGKALALRDGIIDVTCPECGYSLVGLSECICPECGLAMTIDELIRRQNYRTTVPLLTGTTESKPPIHPESVVSTIEPPPALPDIQ